MLTTTGLAVARKRSIILGAKLPGRVMSSWCPAPAGSVCWAGVRGTLEMTAQSTPGSSRMARAQSTKTASSATGVSAFKEGQSFHETLELEKVRGHDRPGLLADGPKNAVVPGDGGRMARRCGPRHA